MTNGTSGPSRVSPRWGFAVVDAPHRGLTPPANNLRPSGAGKNIDGYPYLRGWDEH